MPPHGARQHAGAARPGQAGGQQRKVAPKKPFVMGTRQRVQPVGAQIAIPAGGNSPWSTQAFPQVGLAMRILLHVRILVNVGGTAMGVAFKPAYKGPWSFLRQVSLNFNLGATNIVQCSGFGLAIRQASMQRGNSHSTSNAAVGNGSGRDPFFNLGYNGATFAAANSVVPFEFVIEVPIAGNDGLNFTLGLINLQSPEVQLILSGNYGSLTDITSNASATSAITGGYMQPYLEYYEVPPPKNNVAMPPLIVHRIAEDITPVVSTGSPTQYTIPRQGKLLRLMQYFDNGGSLVFTGAPQIGSASWLSPVSPGILNWSLVANITDTVYNEDYIVRRWRMADMFGDPGDLGANVPPAQYAAATNSSVAMLPPLLGGNIWELWGAQGEPARGNFRDVLDAEALTTLQFNTTVDPGLSLGTSPYLGHVREFWQPLSRGALRGPGRG